MAAAVGLGEDLAAEWVSKRVEAVADEPEWADELYVMKIPASYQ